MVLSALGCCTDLPKSFGTWIASAPGTLLLNLKLWSSGWGVRLARRVTTKFPGIPSLPSLCASAVSTRWRSFEWIICFLCPPSYAPWPNRALVVPEFIFIGGRSNSGRLGSIAASPIVDTLPLIKTTTNSNTILQQCPTDFFYFYWNSTLQVSPKVKKVLQLLRLRQQWRVHQAQKGYHQHAPHLWWVVGLCPSRSRRWLLLFSSTQSWHWTAMLINGCWRF